MSTLPKKAVLMSLVNACTINDDGGIGSLQWISKCHSALWRRMNFVDVTTSVTVNSAPRLVRAVAMYDGIVAKAFLPSITKDNCTASDFIAETLKEI